MVLIKVCSMDILPAESMKQFYVRECEILVINHNGQVFSLDARCTHAGAPLVEGTLNGDILTCPWHGSQFRISNGAAVKGPAEKELKTYPVTVKDNSVFIDV
jgi:nitrite reductase/ring-hydroxylating ferredoxin subunit